MTTTRKTFIASLLAWVFLVPAAFGQKIDDARMDRDIEIAENILSTLIKQQFEQERTFFSLEIRGSYQPGYGVTFRLPADYATLVAITLRSNSDMTIWNDQGLATINVGSGNPVHEEGRIRNEDEGNTKTSYSLKDKAQQQAQKRQQMDADSVRKLYDFKITSAIKSFIVDYGDLMTQLPPAERIIITNKGDQARNIMDQYLSIQPTLLSIEGLKSNVMAFKQGKLSRDQALKTITVVNTAAVDKAEPDMELLSTIFNRLYRADLSKTYFTEENIYYEHLKDFGAVYYMQVYSAWRIDPLNPDRIAMPTLGLMDVEPELRDKKVKELYPQFEQDLKVNMLEYGRTLKSLNDNESLIFNVGLTRCAGCGIPSTLELAVKASVLKDFASGKLDQSAALNKFQIKKGLSQ